MRADEAVVFTDIQRHGEGGAQRLESFPKPPFARLGDDDALEAADGQGAADLARKRMRVVRVVQPDVPDTDPGRLQALCETAHPGENQSDLLPVMGDVGCFLPNLRKQDQVPGPVDIRQ